MTKFHFNIGAEVHCKDGQYGKLLKVVVNPHTERVTDLIAEKGFLLKTDRVVPVSAVESTIDEEIRLSITGDKLEDYPEYREIEFRKPAAGWIPEKQYRAKEVLHYASRYGVIPRQPVVPMVRKRVHEGISPELAVIERGTPVHNVKGEIGEVNHVLVDQESLEITHLIVDPGLFSHSLVLPISMVKEVGEESIYVEATEEKLKELSRYTPRADADILAELQDRLEAAPFDFGDVKAALENGVVRLTGAVPDVATKRHAEATARSVEGVLDVENALAADTAIAAQVTAALATDPRTELAVIEVINTQGIVTLKGQVDSPEVREAAEEIAAQQPGAISVINALEVKPDEDTESLKSRLLVMGMPPTT
jgi:osmotically-inducible protein OsmY